LLAFQAASASLRPALDRNFCSKAFDPVQNFLLGKQALSVSGSISAWSWIMFE
jgi:hypothetical protein